MCSHTHTHTHTHLHTHIYVLAVIDKQPHIHIISTQVIRQPFPHTPRGTDPTLIPIVAGVGGSVLLVLLLVVAVMCVGLLWLLRKRIKDKVHTILFQFCSVVGAIKPIISHTQYTLHDPGGETGTIPTDDFVVHPIDDQHRPSNVISIGEPSHIGM